VVSSEGLIEPFVVSSESEEASGPCEASFYDPSSWQQHEATLCFGVFEDLQLDAMLGRRIGCSLPGVALVDVGQLNAAPSDLLDIFGQSVDLGAVLFA